MNERASVNVRVDKTFNTMLYPVVNWDAKGSGPRDIIPTASPGSSYRLCRMTQNPAAQNPPSMTGCWNRATVPAAQTLSFMETKIPARPLTWTKRKCNENVLEECITT
jgi:hypothetical protein